MIDREALTLLLPLFIAGAIGAVMAMVPAGAPPQDCAQPAIAATDADQMRCDGEGIEPGARAWLVGRRLDVNRASAADLRRLPKVGEGAASSIVESRELDGAFANVDALTRVKGMGPKTLDRIRPLIVATPPR